MTRRNLAAVLSVVALLAAACGGGGDGGGGGGTDPTGDLPDLSGQRVNVVAVWTGTEQRRFEEVLAGFEEATGAEAEFTSAGSADLTTFIGTRIEGGEPPDVALMPNPGLLVDFAEDGALKSVEEAAGDLVDENFAPGWRDVATVDGTLYGVFFKVANKSTFWYNANVFEGAGVEAPASWEDLQTVAQTVSDFGVTPFAIDGASAWVLTDWFENVYVRTAGPEMYDQLARHEIPWTDQSVKDALETLAQVWGNEDWILGGPNGALQGTFPERMKQVFTPPDQPEAAMYYEGDFVGGIINAETDAEVGTDADFFDFPSINDSPPSVISSGDVAVMFTESEAAKALIRYLATPEAAEIWAREGGFTSPNTAVDSSVYPDEASQRAAQALAEAEEVRYDLSDLQPAEFGGTTGQGLFGGFQDFLKNPDDVDGVTARLEEAAAQAYGGEEE